MSLDDMRLAGRLPFALLVGLLLLPGAAHTAPSATEQKGVQLFNQSEVSYRAGRFREAAELLREAYALLKSPTLLYNLARALESDGELQGALEAYRQYLVDEQKVPDRAAIERRIASLERQLRERQELEAQRTAAEQARVLAEERLQQTVSAPPEPAAQRPARKLPWIMAAAGGVVIGAGALLGGFALAQHGAGVREQRSQLAADQLEAGAERLSWAANVLYAVGGLAALAGVVWGIVDVGRADVQVTFAPVGPGFAVVGRW